MRLQLMMHTVFSAPMSSTVSQLRSEFPVPLLAVLAVTTGFIVFLTIDQMHWWQLKPDYAFGWLVPVLVAYVIYDRSKKMRTLFQVAGPSPLPRWLDKVFSLGAGMMFAMGLLFFLLGALYRAGSGATQPGSLALAVGFSGVLLGMVYFNVPAGQSAAHPLTSRWSSLWTDSRLQAVGLFVFPALIWMLSAPLVTAVENAVSIFLLRKVVTVVFFVFSVLGCPLVQEGNVLVFPHGQVGVADACSGIRSLTGCLFAGSFLAAMFLDKLWKKVLLIVAAVAFAFFMNLLRSLFLAGWAYAYGSEAIEGTLHDVTGLAVLGLTTVGLFLMLPLFSQANWRKWLGIEPALALAPATANTQIADTKPQAL
jgi:exosortase